MGRHVVVDSWIRVRQATRALEEHSFRSPFHDFTSRGTFGNPAGSRPSGRAPVASGETRTVALNTILKRNFACGRRPAGTRSSDPTPANPDADGRVCRGQLRACSEPVQPPTEFAPTAVRHSPREGSSEPDEPTAKGLCFTLGHVTSGRHRDGKPPQRCQHGKGSEGINPMCGDGMR